jgi:hypothetical protein
MPTFVGTSLLENILKNAGIDKAKAKTPLAKVADYGKLENGTDYKKTQEALIVARKAILDWHVGADLKKIWKEKKDKALEDKFDNDMVKLFQTIDKRVVELTEEAEVGAKVQAGQAIQGLEVKDILKNKVLADALYKFTKGEFSAENYEFATLTKAPMFASASAPDDAKSIAMKKKLYETYVKTSAPKQINIKASTLTELTQLADAGTFHLMNFSAAQTEIVKMMSKDTVARFVRSKEFEAVQDKLKL